MNTPQERHNKERFIRWQSILREHLTNLNSLLLTIAIGMIGFIFSLLTKPDFKPIQCQRFFFTVGLIFIFLSIILGLSTALSRLIDFRTTTSKIKNEINGASPESLDELKELMKLYGKTTWRLFYSQVATLSLGTINLVIAFCLIYAEKLF